MEGVLHDLEPVTRGAYVVGKTTDGSWMASHVVLLPLADERDKEVTFELAVKHLTQEVQVWNKGSLEDDGDVGGVEQFDRVGRVLATVASRLDW